MDPITTSILTSLGSGILTNFSTDIIRNFFSSVFTLNPELEDELVNAKTYTDIEEVFRKAVGVIDANAHNSTINVNGAFLTAIKGIRFNHADGTVTIQGTEMRVPIIVTGGSSGSKGETLLGEKTTLRSQGTSIEIGKGCSIQISGDARIEQN